MSIKHIQPCHLDAWLEALIAAGPVYGVQAEGERFAFDELRLGEYIEQSVPVNFA